MDTSSLKRAVQLDILSQVRKVILQSNVPGGKDNKSRFPTNVNFLSITSIRYFEQVPNFSKPSYPPTSSAPPKPLP